MIYLIDEGFGIKNALNFLINEVKYPKKYNRCFSVSCNSDSIDFNVIDINVYDKANDNGFPPRTLAGQR